MDRRDATRRRTGRGWAIGVVRLLALVVTIAGLGQIVPDAPRAASVHPTRSEGPATAAAALRADPCGAREASIRCLTSADEAGEALLRRAGRRLPPDTRMAEPFGGGAPEPPPRRTVAEPPDRPPRRG